MLRVVEVAAQGTTRMDLHRGHVQEGAGAREQRAVVLRVALHIVDVADQGARRVGLRRGHIQEGAVVRGQQAIVLRVMLRVADVADPGAGRVDVHRGHVQEGAGAREQRAAVQQVLQRVVLRVGVDSVVDDVGKHVRAVVQRVDRAGVGADVIRGGRCRSRRPNWRRRRSSRTATGTAAVRRVHGGGMGTAVVHGSQRSIPRRSRCRGTPAPAAPTPVRPVGAAARGACPGRRRTCPSSQIGRSRRPTGSGRAGRIRRPTGGNQTGRGRRAGCRGSARCRGASRMRRAGRSRCRTTAC
mmetsp:Transcript_6832/g.21971  ORF Transcript_6832/g.21971 Transcript_6832/m.21971 type:complete len:298 (-) Transcript_6832:183-1076(-)